MAGELRTACTVCTYTRTRNAWICSSPPLHPSTRLLLLAAANLRRPAVHARRLCVAPVAVWTRPGQQDRDSDFVKPSYVPTPITQPSINPGREQTVYTPSAPEFRPAELPDRAKEMPSGPKMPERRPDPIPAGNPKEKPGEGGAPDKREAPPKPSEKEAAPKK